MRIWRGVAGKVDGGPRRDVNVTLVTERWTRRGTIFGSGRPESKTGE